MNTDVTDGDSNRRVDNQSNVLYFRENELIQKYSRLKVLKDLMTTNEVAIISKEKILNKETNTLDQLNQQVWILHSQMCQKVWNFSENHDFVTALLINYPDISTEFRFDCDCKEEHYIRADSNQTEIKKLGKEIEDLGYDLKNEEKCYSILKEDLKKADEQWQECKNNSTDHIKLENKISNCRRRVIDLQGKQIRKDSSLKNKGIFSDKQFDTNGSSIFDQPSYNNFIVPFLKTQCLNNESQTLIPSIQTDCNLKRKLSDTNRESVTNDLHFIKASTYLKNTNSLTLSNDFSDCKNVTNITVPPRKKFVCKTKSILTRKSKVSK